MNALLVAVVAPLWIAFLVVQIRCDSLAKELYTRVNGTSQGYSWRKFRKNLDKFAVPPHEELARKIKALDRVLTYLLMTFLMLAFLIAAAHELGKL